MAKPTLAVSAETAPNLRAPCTASTWCRLAARVAAAVALCVPGASLAQSNNVRITKLSDVSFGSLANLGTDASMAQNICVFAATSGNRYRVTATGSAPGGAFALTSGSSQLAYEVQWNAASGQSSGTQLNPSVAQTGLTSSATQQTCNSGPASSASLILLLRSTALSSATAGSYSGTLTLIIGAD
jgi:spore coat protein U-like protein